MTEAMESLVFNQMLTSIIGFVVTTVGGLAVGYFVGRFKKHRQMSEEEQAKRDEIENARIVIEKATARRLIFEAYDDYVIQRKHLTIDRAEEITETYTAYRLLGGNGTAKKYYECIMDINPYLVTD